MGRKESSPPSVRPRRDKISLGTEGGWQDKVVRAESEATATQPYQIRSQWLMPLAEDQQEEVDRVGARSPQNKVSRPQKYWKRLKALTASSKNLALHVDEFLKHLINGRHDPGVGLEASLSNDEVSELLANVNVGLLKEPAAQQASAALKRSAN